MSEKLGFQKRLCIRPVRRLSIAQVLCRDKTELTSQVQPLPNASTMGREPEELMRIPAGSRSHSSLDSEEFRQRRFDEFEEDMAYT